MSQLELNHSASSESSKIYADVIVPVPVPKTFTYSIPVEMQEYVQPGCRVLIQLGQKKILTGLVEKLNHNENKGFSSKPIIDLLDEYPSVNQKQITFFRWLSSYYLSPIGDVVNAALPSGLKITSESYIQLNPNYNPNIEYSDNENLIVDLLHEKASLSFKEVSKFTGLKSIHKLLKFLVEKEAIILFQETKDKYQPKKEKKIGLHEKFRSESKLNQLFDQLEKSPKQTDVVLKFLQLAQNDYKSSITKKDITDSERISASSLSTLISKGILTEKDQTIPRFQFSELNELKKSLKLSNEQSEVKSAIAQYFESKDIFLLHGITGSGKTAIYIELIKEALENETQVLFLLPEIALTTQIVIRLGEYFGNSMGIYHSRFSDNERVEVWKGVLNHKLNFVVGVRSSVFLPFDNLGLIIIDEEHDASYKQYDPSPRYQARDSAIVLAKQHGAKVLLGSATPSIESYYNAEEGKYGYCFLDKRYGNASKPEIQIIDLLKKKKSQLMHGDFSDEMIDTLTEVIQKEQQAILFQNRRGYSPTLGCEDCGEVLMCDNCSVSLTYHKFREQMQCHYCGYKTKVPQECPTCGSTKLSLTGFGTEKLEEDIASLIPEARVQRMDQDTTRGKYNYQKILTAFDRHEIDILIGTQMVSKGLDFNRVTLVGIMDADRMMYYPDFRALENTYQLVKQVSGRSGRDQLPGKVIIQTTQPNHWLLRMIETHEERSFYKGEILEREKFSYPPLSRLIEIKVRNRDKLKCLKASEKLVKELFSVIGERVSGPAEPMISKIRNQYLYTILIRLEKKGIDIKSAKEKILEIVTKSHSISEIKGSQIVIDVDPR
ncbi:MAG: primosomal protein N' [Bacteroidota bacterium]